MSVTESKARKGTASRQGAGRALRPSEWDFRGINPNHLDAILFYERAREDLSRNCAWALIKEHRRAIFGWDAGIFSKGDLADQFPGLAPRDIYKCCKIISACWMGKKFPVPWMEMGRLGQDEAAMRFAANESFTRYLGYRLLSRGELARMEATEADARRMFPDSNFEDQSVSRLIIQIDWRRVEDSVLKGILLNLRPPGIGPKKHTTGKRAAPPVHKLKQLAAWRLAARAKLNYRQAKEKTRTRQQLFPIDCDLDVLPIYASDGAWKGAVDAGAGFVERGI